MEKNNEKLVEMALLTVLYLALIGVLYISLAETDLLYILKNLFIVAKTFDILISISFFIIIVMMLSLVYIEVLRETGVIKKLAILTSKGS